MCGIYGVLGSRRAPQSGLSAIRRRGPDQVAHWHDDHVWLGHARLAIIDLSAAGAQPMHSPDGRLAMIYNGEIYNFRELRDELEGLGESFVGQSDSEVLLRLFQREGAACFSRLNGIFAAAFWDRGAQLLTLVRDPLGVKPLYYTDQGGHFAFASEIKALIRAGDVTPQIGRDAVLHHLGLLWSPGRGTIARQVSKLLPGEVLEVRLGQPVRVYSYSDISMPDPRRKGRWNEAETIERVRTGVEAAVARQLVSDVPLGSFLSGGLDSSAIAAFASRRRSGPGRLQCFSIEVAAGTLSGEGFADDLPYARRVAEHLGVDLHVVRADVSMFDRLQEMIYFLDEPTADMAALNTLLISELARSQGITVLLSGSGGDDIFTGYRRHYALMQERYWSWLPRTARLAMTRTTALLPANNAIGRRITKAFQHAGEAADQRLAGYFAWIAPETALDLLTSDFRGGLDADAVLAPLLDTLNGVPADASPLDKMLYLERRHFLADHNLNYADKMGMAAGIEIRVPLLDHDLVKDSLAISDRLKQRGRTGKWVFKKAMEPFLPHDVIYRPKTGFGVPLRQWLTGPLDPMVREVLSPHSLKARGIFDPVRVEALIEATRSGRRDASYTIFAILCIELWCQQYVDGQYALDLAA